MMADHHEGGLRLAVVRHWAPRLSFRQWGDAMTLHAPSTRTLFGFALGGALAVATLMSTPPVQAQRLPPPEARAACQGRQSGDACSFQTPRGQMTGTCRTPPRPGPGAGLVCAPAGAGGGPGGPPPGRPSGGPPGFGGSDAGQAQVGGWRPKLGYTPRAADPAAIPTGGRLSDTGQVTCFDNVGPITCPAPGEPFFGQDASYAGTAPALRNTGDGTVSDPVTGLVWEQGHDGARLSFAEAKRKCAALTLGGRNGWRLPTIKELFSISHWQGVTGQRPFIDATVFDIAPPDASLLTRDRFAATHDPVMMGQTWSATLYQGDHWDQPGVEAAFFFNVLDGRIKQAPTAGRGPGLFARCVSGSEWGVNQFRNNGDGTVTDGLTDLIWQQADDGVPRDWPAALAYCNGLTLAGHDDWRLPNVKELQSIVDYSRPQPAIDTRSFRQADPAAWFWSSTTHGDQPDHAAYVCFGKCTSTEGVDVHGAGAQRSDPKTGDPNHFGPRGGQRDATRINNAVRCVRG